jgi:hypothetical protein
MHNLNVLSTLKEQKYIALVVLTALVMWSVGVPTFINRANALNLVELSDTLSESNPGDPSVHTIQFTVPTGSDIATGDEIRVTFPAGFTNVDSITATDVSLDVDGTPQTVAAVADASDWGLDATGQVITLTAPSAGTPASAGDVVDIVIGDTNRITNPGAGSYVISVETHDGATKDAGDTRVMIIDNVTMTAAVETTFQFTVTGIMGDGAEVVNGETITSGYESTSTTLPFGTLNTNSPVVLAQDLSVQTNAQHGFVVTVEQDQNLLSATGADINVFKDQDGNGGFGTATPEAWVPPANVLDDRWTYGHYGITSDDSTLASLTDATGVFNTDYVTPAAALWAGNITTPRAVFAHNGPSDGTTQDRGAARIGFKIEIGPLQEAANDYINTITYIATPTF